MIASLLIIVSTSSFGSLKTIAELSEWKKTGRADETERLCKDFAKAYPKDLLCEIYGKTPEGRNLHALITKGKGPTIWVQAGIHSGEIDGKDAVFFLLREIFEEKKYPDLLKGIKLVFIPIVNLDGHERFDKWNRPNQVGPEEMGWRTTAQNLNLNRDFAKADAPEMQALIKLWLKMDPILSLDLHVTDGAQFQPEVGIITTTQLQAGKNLEKVLMEKMQARGRMALPFYPSFEIDDDPKSGFARYVASPRFSQGYWANQNRIGMLVETHSWKDYATRVKSHHDTVLSVLEIAGKDAKAWVKEAKGIDQNKLASLDIDLEYKISGKFKTIDFPGYDYSITESAISGKKVITYNPKVNQTWKVPLYDELIPSLTMRVPAKGYFIPAQAALMMKEKLSLHGIRFEVLKKSQEEEFDHFRAIKTEFSPTPFEGRQTLTVTGEWKKEKTNLMAGSLYVPIDQPRGRLVMQLLEPRAKDSFLSWGFFNAHFEQKEYMEDYVAEEVAVEMLKDPKIKEEFDNLVENDEEFEKSPQKRLGFFYQKHSSYDKKFNLYPILRQ